MPLRSGRADCLTLLVALAAMACGTPDVESDTVRASPAPSRQLPPSAFAELPAGIVDDLTARGCSIPQSYPDSTPHNVVRGRFGLGDQSDIAALCLRDTTSVILVYRGALADSVVELAPRPHLQAELSDTSSGFTFPRAIGLADSAFIQSRFERYGGPRPPVLDHLGINDIFVGKASVVWYWHRGQWLQLQGSD